MKARHILYAQSTLRESLKYKSDTGWLAYCKIMHTIGDVYIAIGALALGTVVSLMVVGILPGFY